MTNRGRVQAQGGNIEKSKAWAKDDALTKADAKQHLDDLEGELTHGELQDRDQALIKARTFVNRAPITGYPAVISKSFSNPTVRRSIRIDVEVHAGLAFTL